MEYPHVYLAGPDVFARNALAHSQELKEICKNHKLIGHFPLDNELPTSGKPPQQIGHLISEKNEELIRKCDGVLANLTPFRGPSADPGTVYEVGFARGLGKVIVGYTDTGATFRDRTVQWLKRLGEAPSVRDDGTPEDARRMSIEDFDMMDNLMIPGGIEASGGTVFVPNGSNTGLRELAALAADELARQLNNVRKQQ